MRRFILSCLILLVTVTAGCSKKADPAPAGADAPPAAGETSDTTGNDGNGAEGTAETPVLVRESLQRGMKSPDGQWVAAMVSGDAATTGIWVAKADLGDARRVAEQVATGGVLPVWSPGGHLLYPNADGDWQQAEPPEWSATPYLPDLLKGKQALIRPGAFAPNGQQFVYSVAVGNQQQSWLAGNNGANIRTLGLDVVAGWNGSELVVTPRGK